MQIANCWVQINELGSNARKERVTPAECQVLRKLFGVKVVGQTKPTNPITHLHIVGEDKRSVTDEFSRLTQRYGEKLIGEMFPGENPGCPDTFKAAGFEETEEKQPKEGKKHVIEPLASLKKGDDGADMEAESAQVTALKKQIEDLKKSQEVKVPSEPVKPTEPKK